MKGVSMLNKALKDSNLTLIPINLQLFAGDPDADVEEFDDSDLDVEELEEGDEEDDNFSEMDEDSKGSKEQEAADPADDIDHEKNEKFKKMRIKAEEQAKKKFEAEKAQLEAERAQFNALKQEMEIRQAEQRIDDMFLTQQKVWDKADQENVPEEIARKLLLAEAQKFKADERAKIRARYEAIEQQKNLLKNDKHFTLLAPEVEKVLDQNPNLDFQTIYYHMKGMRAEELDKKLETMTVKRTIADIQDRSRRRSVPSTGGAANVPTTNLSKTTLEINNFLGIDSREVAKHKAKNAHRFRI